MKRKCPAINNFEINGPVYSQQGSQVKSRTVLLLQIIIGDFGLLVYGTECSVQVESGALSLDTVESILPWLTLKWVHFSSFTSKQEQTGPMCLVVCPTFLSVLLLMPLRQFFPTVYGNQMGICSYVRPRKEG